MEEERRGQDAAPAQSSSVVPRSDSIVTDAVGRVVKAEGVLDLQRMDRNTYQQLGTGDIGGADDQFEYKDNYQQGDIMQRG